MDRQQQKVFKDLRAKSAAAQSAAAYYEQQARKWCTLYLETKQDRSKYKLWTFVQLGILAVIAVKTVVQLANGA